MRPNILKSPAVALIYLAASACTNADGTMGERGSVVWFNQSSAAQKKAYFSEVCTGYGFDAKTPEMAQCIANEHHQMSSARSAAISNIANSGPKYCNSFGTTITCY